MELHVGVDSEKTVVSAYPLRSRSGRIRRTRVGTLVETSPCAPSGRTLEQRVVFAARVALPLLFVSAVAAAFGFSWWLAAAGSAGLVGYVWRRQARAAQIAAFAVPRDEALPQAERARVLWTAAERTAFDGALASSRRVRATWPALAGMVDPVLADRSLTRALDELATVLGRRQELRRLRADLSGVEVADIPVDSPARAAVIEQAERADALWRETGAAADRILASIETAARAGESFLRERQVAATARYAERTLARVTGTPAAAESGPELADRTEAVIAAYRDLAV
ncbi:hypothetical protein [Actinoplanes sp. OR16]|uniref:hypothetical protein n=1 Tax=Actinoplanes sp. OR16 TaxID=946334 RepID=UPI000FD7FDCA|nr:hypothetical protein [Actinoplanes sp. OR16]